MTNREKKIFTHKTVILLLSVISIALLCSHSLVFANWAIVDLPVVSSSWQLTSVRFVSNNEGWAVGKDSLNKKGVVLHFVNGSWTSVILPYPSSDWELWGIDFVRTNEGWAVGRDNANQIGILFHYSSGSWSSVSPINIVSLNWELHGVRLMLTDEALVEGWAVGKDTFSRRGVLLHFSSGVWRSVPPPDAGSDWELWSIDFPTTDEGWAVGADHAGEQGVLLHYSNGSWTSVTPPGVSSLWLLYSVDFVSTGEGWAVGTDQANRRGVLLRYSDGWTSVTPPDVSSNWELWDIHFISANEGWAVGNDYASDKGVLLRYFGGSWTLVTPPEVSSCWELSGIQTLSSMEAWAVGWVCDESNLGGLVLKYGSPSISVSPTSLPYREVPIGAYYDKTVTVGNAGKGNLTIGAIPSPSPPFAITTDNCSGKTLAPQHSCSVVYRFSPTAEGSFTDSCDIPSDDPKEAVVQVTLSGTGVTGPPLYIDLVGPSDGERFTVCSYYDPPTFQWDPSEAFKSIEVQFSLQEDFPSVSSKAAAKKGVNELLLKSSLWKNILSLPGPDGGTVYWKVVGTRASDNTKVPSSVFSLKVAGPEMVTDPAISSTSKTAPPPTLSWEDNCNTTFKVWFGNTDDFKIKKKALSFKVKNPNDNGGQFQKTLTSSQWSSIRKLVGDEIGPPIYWYVESWDVLKNRSAKTEVMNFILTEE